MPILPWRHLILQQDLPCQRQKMSYLAQAGIWRLSMHLVCAVTTECLKLSTLTKGKHDLRSLRIHS